MNRLFYKVLDQNTIIVVPESQAKRRIYDDVLLRTFYIQNAESRRWRRWSRPPSGPQARWPPTPRWPRITIMGTLDELALAERVIDANDKARGEVLVEVEILEVNRTKLKDYGIELSNYGAGASPSRPPRSGRGRAAGGCTTSAPTCCPR